MSFIKRHHLLGLASFVCLTLKGSDLLGITYTVTEGSGSGTGSFPAAVDAVNASSDADNEIVINVGAVLLPSTQTFTNSASIYPSSEFDTVTLGLISSGLSMQIEADIQIIKANLESLSASILNATAGLDQLGVSTLGDITVNDATLNATLPSNSSTTIPATWDLIGDSTFRITGSDLSASMTGAVAASDPSATWTISATGPDVGVTFANATSTQSDFGATATFSGLDIAFANPKSFSAATDYNLNDASITFAMAEDDSVTVTGDFTNIGGNSSIAINSGSYTFDSDFYDVNILAGGAGTQATFSRRLQNSADNTSLSASDRAAVTVSGTTSSDSIDFFVSSDATLTLDSDIASTSTLTMTDAELILGRNTSIDSLTLFGDATITGETLTTGLLSFKNSTQPALGATAFEYGLIAALIKVVAIEIEDHIIGNIGGHLDAPSATAVTISGPSGSTIAFRGDGTFFSLPPSISIGNGITTIISHNATFGNTNCDIFLTDSKLRILPSGRVYAKQFRLNQEARLEGTGSIQATNGIVIGFGATAQAGMSPGTLSITGDVSFEEGSTMEVAITSDDTSFLDVTGAVDLDSGVTLHIIPAADCYQRHNNFTILGATDGLTGSFSTVELNSLLLNPTVRYGTHGIELQINRTPLRDLDLQGNSQAVAAAIDALIDGSPTLCGVIGSLVLSSLGEINSALDQLQPSLFKGLTISQENNAVKVQDSLSYRMQTELDSVHCHPINTKTEGAVCNKEKKTFQVWVNGMGDALSQDKSFSRGSSHVGYHESMGGVVLGADYNFMDCLYAGALGAYTDSDIKWNNGRGKGDIQSAYAGLYVSALGEMFYGNVSVIGAWSHYDAHRNIDLPNNSFTAKNKHGGAQLLSHADTGINLGWGGFTIRPFNSFDYISQTENGYTETGAGELNLQVKKSNSIMLRNELGLNFAHCLCAKGSRFIISPKISWVREVRIKGAQSIAEFTGTDQSFTVTGYFPNRSLVSPGLSLTAVAFKDLLTMELYYNGEFNGSYSDHSYGGQVKLSF